MDFFNEDFILQSAHYTRLLMIASNNAGPYNLVYDSHAL